MSSIYSRVSPRMAVLAAALFMFFLRSGAAQEPSRPDSAPRFSIGSTQSMLGYVSLGSNDLDARFAAAGLPRVARSAATIGIGADVRGGRALFGAGFQSILARSHTTSAHRTRMSGSYSLFDFGLAALRGGRTTIYPLAGVGVTHLALNVRERAAFAFDDGLQAPTRELGLSGTAALVHAGLLVEQRIQRASGAEFAIALRAGVTRSVGTQSWQSDETRVDGGPAGVHGSYARIVFSRPLQSRRDAGLPIVGTLLQALLQ